MVLAGSGPGAKSVMAEETLGEYDCLLGGVVVWMVGLLLLLLFRAE